MFSNLRMLPDQGAAAPRRYAGQSDGSAYAKAAVDRQFRFAVHGLAPVVAEFYRWRPERSERRPR